MPGLIIHEGQLTYGDHQLQLVVDLGQWWKDKTGLPLPLAQTRCGRILAQKQFGKCSGCSRRASHIGLKHRQDALRYAQRYGRDLDDRQADQFVGMYVNDWTLDFGPRGREAVALFLAEGHEAGVLPELVVPEFVQ